VKWAKANLKREFDAFSYCEGSLVDFLCSSTCEITLTKDFQTLFATFASLFLGSACSSVGIYFMCILSLSLRLFKLCTTFGVLFLHSKHCQIHAGFGLSIFFCLQNIDDKKN